MEHYLLEYTHTLIIYFPLCFCQLSQFGVQLDCKVKVELMPLAQLSYKLHYFI